MIFFPHRHFSFLLLPSSQHSHSTRSHRKNLSFNINLLSQHDLLSFRPFFFVLKDEKKFQIERQQKLWEDIRRLISVSGASQRIRETVCCCDENFSLVAQFLLDTIKINDTFSCENKIEIISLTQVNLPHVYIEFWMQSNRKSNFNLDVIIKEMINHISINFQGLLLITNTSSNLQKM